ncbi:MAG TPA: RpiB/LacA/LacB family sugar-phosphate isomerase, partial [Candidatus Sulfotelmatobacter sp.]|nr:RpiB/LacA/LacB family sugar-phosphate isomerase [Candidatus Sulfotelmatobacter sp.]
RGILMCGTGIGMAITANKVPGVRAATCHDTYSAERARKSNNAQILTMGARVIGPELAKTIVDAWLASEFEGGGSAPKVEKIMEYDEKFRRK